MAIDYARILSEALHVGSIGWWDGPELDELRVGCPLALSGAMLMDKRCVLATPPLSMPLSEVLAAMSKLSERTDALCVCALPTGMEGMSRMLHQRDVPFVTAEGGAFVPGLLRLAGTKAMPQRRGNLSPAARVAFLWLCQRPWQDSTATALAEQTGMPRATAQRAMAELREVLPMSVHVGGKTRRALVCRVGDPWAFTAAGSMLFGHVPAARRILPAKVASVTKLPLAGASALSLRSRLATPGIEVRACSRVQARTLVEPTEGKTACEVLVLPYDPQILASDGVVDLGTMALTCGGSDPLVAAALAEAVEEMPWLLSLA